MNESDTQLADAWKMPAEVAEVFAEKMQGAKETLNERILNQFEWKYLCSWQWFLSGIDRALEIGDFFPIQVRAEEALVDAKLRRETPRLSKDERSHDYSSSDTGYRKQKTCG